MESKRFDDLSRAVATMSSRRGVLRGIVGGAVAGVVGGIRLRGADAAGVKRKNGEICRKPGDCESNQCVPDGTGTGRSRCACGEGFTLCNGACCDTYCDSNLGCLDSLIDVGCYNFCESTICTGMNNFLNFNQTNLPFCLSQCADYCMQDS